MRHRNDISCNQKKCVSTGGDNYSSLPAGVTILSNGLFCNWTSKGKQRRFITELMQQALNAWLVSITRTKRQPCCSNPCIVMRRAEGSLPPRPCFPCIARHFHFGQSLRFWTIDRTLRDATSRRRSYSIIKTCPANFVQFEISTAHSVTTRIRPQQGRWITVVQL